MEVIKRPRFILGSFIVFLGIGIGTLFNIIAGEYPEWSNMRRLLNEVKIPVVLMIILLGLWFLWLSVRKNKKTDLIVVLAFLILFIVFVCLFLISLL